MRGPWRPRRPRLPGALPRGFEGRRRRARAPCEPAAPPAPPWSTSRARRHGRPRRHPEGLRARVRGRPEALGLDRARRSRSPPTARPRCAWGRRAIGENRGGVKLKAARRRRVPPTDGPGLAWWRARATPRPATRRGCTTAFGTAEPSSGASGWAGPSRGGDGGRERYAATGVSFWGRPGALVRREPARATRPGARSARSRTPERGADPEAQSVRAPRGGRAGARAGGRVRASPETRIPAARTRSAFIDRLSVQTVDVCRVLRRFKARACGPSDLRRAHPARRPPLYPPAPDGRPPTSPSARSDCQRRRRRLAPLSLLNLLVAGHPPELLPTWLWSASSPCPGTSYHLPPMHFRRPR